MTRRKMLGVALTVTLSILIHAGDVLAAVWHVDGNALPGGDGLSWGTALNSVQSGINAAAVGDEVWVKQGIYYERLVVKDGVALYGHFAGFETSPAQRNLSIDNLATILDAQQAGTVVTIAYCSSQATRVDGFTIRNGSTGADGGGMVVDHSYATIANNTFTGNSARDGGGAYLLYSSPLLRNNTFVGNIANSKGGGICAFEGSSLIVESNTFASNASYGGGAIFLWNGYPVVRNNRLQNNDAKGGFGGGMQVRYTPALISGNTITGNGAWRGGGISVEFSAAVITNNRIAENRNGSTYPYNMGGGIYHEGDSTRSATIANNVIARNYATDWGGGIFMMSGTPRVHNNTVVGNAASGGGGISVSGYLESPSIVNNIIAYGSSGIFCPYSGGNPYLSRNLLYGNGGANYAGVTPGATDILADPMLVAYASEDYHLTPGSPCINAGDNGVVQPGWVDIDGQPRVNLSDGSGIVDIGADEFLDGIPPTTTMTLGGTPGENGWYWSDVAVTLTATDNGSGVARTEYSLDAGGTWITYTVPFTVTTEGVTVVDYRSIDNAGNVEPYLWDEVKIDRIAPVVIGTTPGNGETNVLVGKTIEITFSENVQGGTNFPNIKFYKGKIDPTKEVSTLNDIPAVPGSVLSIDPVANLNSSTTYRVVIPAGSVKDMAGHPLAADYPPYSFDTAP